MPEEQIETMVGMIHNYYDGNEQVKIEAHRSCGMAGMTIMLTAQALVMIHARWMDLTMMRLAIINRLDDRHKFYDRNGKRTVDPFPKPHMLIMIKLLFKIILE